jgi:Cu+-exporting ATPase
MQVYLLLSENNLCNYYDLEKTPGITAKGKFIDNRFAYLDDEKTIQQLLQYSSPLQNNIIFRLPQMHCSSCVYLLENMHRINEGVISSRVNFQRKEIFVSYNPSLISLRKLVELLAFIGYEPDISLQDAKSKPPATHNRKELYRLGIAGFCFSNIMMLSFPEYFSGGFIEEAHLKTTFTWLIFFLSLPVIFYSAGSILSSAYKGLLQKNINIDVPIAFASILTFGRSYYEIISSTGAGYLDSGAGIIFFMLIGRWFQHKTYDALSFERNYKSYFPLGVTVLKNHKESTIPATQLMLNDIIIIRNGEMIPADALLKEGPANIDYSFVSGESYPVSKNPGEIIYAGGMQKGPAIMLQVVKETSQSYITQLWNNDVFKNRKHQQTSFIHPWSRYFTVVLFSIAALTAIFWGIKNPANLFPAVTAVLIIACPCSLLLSATFTFGNVIRILGNHKFFAKNEGVIETLGKITDIVFDKTGTLSCPGQAKISYNGSPLSLKDIALVKTAASQSSHVLSNAIKENLPGQAVLQTDNFSEFAGRGISADIAESKVDLGNRLFMEDDSISENYSSPEVHLKINGNYKGYYSIRNIYRDGLEEMFSDFKKQGYKLHILSGDNSSEKIWLQEYTGPNASFKFNSSPQQKLEYIKALQSEGKKILMVGDGLNDAGALMQADAGIAVSDHSARFTPACDAIMDGEALHKLDSIISYTKDAKKIITAAFIISIIYNVIGISFAASAQLSPLVAAILMPASSISIVLLVSLASSFLSKHISAS